MRKWQRWLGGAMLGFIACDFFTTGPDMFSIFCFLVLFLSFVLDITALPKE